ncbi:MAG TPA: hypothetical protein VF306_12485 [Pirellulales bacterium]
MKRSRRALWILMATLAAALSAVDFSTRRADLARRPPTAARYADKRSAARRRVVTGSMARLARDPSHSTGIRLAVRLSEPPPRGGLWPENFVSLATDARHSAGVDWVERINREQQGRLEPTNRPPIDHARLIAARERLNAARMGWSGCSAYSFGCDHLGRRPDAEQRAMRSSVRSL